MLPWNLRQLISYFFALIIYPINLSKTARKTFAIYPLPRTITTILSTMIQTLLKILPKQNTLHLIFSMYLYGSGINFVSFYDCSIEFWSCFDSAVLFYIWSPSQILYTHLMLLLTAYSLLRFYFITFLCKPFSNQVQCYRFSVFFWTYMCCKCDM